MLARELRLLGRLEKPDAILAEGLRIAFEKLALGEHVPARHWRRMLHMTTLRFLRANDPNVVKIGMGFGVSFLTDAEAAEASPAGREWKLAIDRARELEAEVGKATRKADQERRRAEQAERRLAEVQGNVEGPERMVWVPSATRRSELSELEALRKSASGFQARQDEAGKRERELAETVANLRETLARTQAELKRESRAPVAAKRATRRQSQATDRLAERFASDFGV